MGDVYSWQSKGDVKKEQNTYLVNRPRERLLLCNNNLCNNSINLIFPSTLPSLLPLNVNFKILMHLNW